MQNCPFDKILRQALTHLIISIPEFLQSGRCHSYHFQFCFLWRNNSWSTSSLHTQPPPALLFLITSAIIKGRSITSFLFSSLHFKNTNYKWLKENIFMVFPQTWLCSKFGDNLQGSSWDTFIGYWVWILCLVLSLCGGYFDVYYTAGLIQITVR